MSIYTTLNDLYENLDQASRGHESAIDIRNSAKSQEESLVIEEAVRSFYKDILDISSSIREEEKHIEQLIGDATVETRDLLKKLLDKSDSL